MGWERTLGFSVEQFNDDKAVVFFGVHLDKVSSLLACLMLYISIMGMTNDLINESIPVLSHL